MKLAPEERIIAAALDQAELDNANERGAGARIEFKPGRSCKGDDHHLPRVGRARQGARFDDRGAFRRGDPLGRPRCVRFSPPTSPAVALTDLSSLGPGQDYVDFARAPPQAHQPILPSEHRRFSALLLGHPGRVRLELIATIRGTTQ